MNDLPPFLSHSDRVCYLKHTFQSKSKCFCLPNKIVNNIVYYNLKYPSLHLKHMFVGRDDELRLLEEIWSGRSPKTCAVYGRRRIGKTTLIDRFCADKKHIRLFRNHGQGVMAGHPIFSAARPLTNRKADPDLLWPMIWVQTRSSPTLCKAHRKHQTLQMKSYEEL